MNRVAIYDVVVGECPFTLQVFANTPAREYTALLDEPLHLDVMLRLRWDVGLEVVDGVGGVYAHHTMVYAYLANIAKHMKLQQSRHLDQHDLGANMEAARTKCHVVLQRLAGEDELDAWRLCVGVAADCGQAEKLVPEPANIVVEHILRIPKRINLAFWHDWSAEQRPVRTAQPKHRPLSDAFFSSPCHTFAESSLKPKNKKRQSTGKIRRSWSGGAKMATDDEARVVIVGVSFLF